MPSVKTFMLRIGFDSWLFLAPPGCAGDSLTQAGRLIPVKAWFIFSFRVSQGPLGSPQPIGQADPDSVKPGPSPPSPIKTLKFSVPITARLGRSPRRSPPSLRRWTHAISLVVLVQMPGWLSLTPPMALSSPSSCFPPKIFNILFVPSLVLSLHLPLSEAAISCCLVGTSLSLKYRKPR